MRVIGLDPSLTATGVADADGGLHTIRTVGHDGDPVATRALRLSAIGARLRPHMLDADLIVIEGPAFARNNAYTHLGAGLWWRIIQIAHTAGIRVAVLAPSQLKKLAIGKGSGDGTSKSDMRMALYQRVGLNIADDNQVDATWLRQMGLAHLGDPDAVPLPQTHLAALDKVVWP